MIVRDATDIDFARVVLNMRDADAFEVYSGRFDKTPQTLVADLIASRDSALGMLALCDESLCASPSGPSSVGARNIGAEVQPGEANLRAPAPAVAILGALLEAPGRASVIMIATDEWPRIAKAATRYAMRTAIPAYLAGVRSAECRCWAENLISRLWLARLGFRRVADLEQHDDLGSTFMLYRWINPKFIRAAIRRPRSAADVSSGGR